MFNARAKKEALAEHKKAIKKYNKTVEKINTAGEQLYANRRKSLGLIDSIEMFVNSIANTPKSFDATVAEIKMSTREFRDTESYAEESLKNAIKSGTGAGAGVAGGAAVASLAPTAAMWVATTFGTASTGTAISALSGAAATNAALAWLGGGALAAGGGGMAAGNALLALAGPVGWGIAGGAAVISLFTLSASNKKVAQKAIAETKKIKKARTELEDTISKIISLDDRTRQMTTAISNLFRSHEQLTGADYRGLSESEQRALGVLVNNTKSLAALLNETIK